MANDPRASETKRIGFVGLGNVGLPAATNLLDAGFDVVGYDIRPSEALVAAGGTMATDMAEIAACPLIIQSLPSDQALAATIDGLLPHLAPGQIVVEMSSYPLETKKAAAARVAETGAIMLDCEVSGLPFQVAERTAVLFASGDKAAVDACASAFGAFTARHFYLGGFGAATKMKLIANYMVCAHNLIGAEALNLGAAAGLDPAQMVEVLKPSAAGSTTFANKSALMLSRDFATGRGPFRHMFGYLDRALALARDSRVEAATPMLHRVREVYDIAREQGRHDQDIAGIIEVVEAMSALDKAA
jgi:3-hydroxyisobutyrate dehydrogenase-like beta-hydroxyacid dehydrogenase